MHFPHLHDVFIDTYMLTIKCEVAVRIHVEIFLMKLSDLLGS